MTRKKTLQLKLSIEPIRSTRELENRLTQPSPAVINAVKQLDGDLMIIGVGGKMGPSLAEMAVRAVKQGGSPCRVFGVSTFSQKGLRKKLQDIGVETIQTDILTPKAIDQLPRVRNIVYMIGRKFGSTGTEWSTWATNVHAAGIVADYFQDAHIVAFSSGNVYPFVSIASGGCTEATTPEPVGEYAMSCLGRERMFDYNSNAYGARVVHYRLNYANELRYGIVHDIALRLLANQSIDLTMGHVNIVWQGYANAVALQSFALASSPPSILNAAGPETVSVRWLAERLGGLLGKTPRFVGAESPSALLSNASRCHGLFGYPEVTVDTLAQWTAHWVASGGASLEKPTHFETRDGKF